MRTGGGGFYVLEKATSEEREGEGEGSEHTVGDHVAGVVPVVLDEAEDVGSDLVASLAGGLELGGEVAALDEGAVLADGGEERGAADFLPEIETGVVPGIPSMLVVSFRGVSMRGTYQYWAV